MNVRCLLYRMITIAALLLFLQFTISVVSASPQQEALEKAKALHKQAIEKNEEGNHAETVRLAKQAMAIYNDIYIQVYKKPLMSDQVFESLKKMGASPAEEASLYLKLLKNLGNLEKALAINQYADSVKKGVAHGQEITDEVSALAKDDRKQQIRKMAKAAAGQMRQGKFDKEKLKQQAMGMVQEEMPRQKAMAMQGASHVTDYSHEFIGLSGNYQDAFTKFVDLMFKDKQFIDQVLGFLPDKQKLDFVSTKQKNLNAFLSLVIQHLPQDQEAIRTAFDTWISRKGLILEVQRQFQEALVDTSDPEVREAAKQLTQVRKQLSKLTIADSDQTDDEDVQRQIAELEKEKQLLEVKLIRLSQTYALKKKVDAADCRKIAAQLPDGTVLLDFARVDMFDFEPRDQDNRWLPAHYVVFVMHAGSGERLTMIDLGEAEKIDSIINRFKDELKDENDFLRKGRKLKKRAQKLYNLVFAPIRDTLGNDRQIYISPDGNLNLIPFEVMQNPDGRYLIEDYTFNYLATSRDVLRFREIKEKAGKSVAIGNPKFDLDGKKQPEKSQAIPSDQAGSIPRRSSKMHGSFTPLPHTAEEVKSLESLLGKKNVTIYLGEEASEASLFSHRAPKILHLATHGFFLSDQELGSHFENPLLRSGIALAGANTTLASQSPQNSNGIVTAEKILGLKLRGTEMVVLSACQTGEGLVQSGEGVFGLRRAFVQAGTKSLVMSMWEVPDRETQELMIQFYKNIAAGMNRSHALRQAVLEEMQIAKERYGYAHPLFWGAFVFLGES
jgi:CHAT domain-containing protein